VPLYRRSADLLLTTFAQAHGSRVMTVVLSGPGNDADTRRHRRVHRFGGTVIAATLASSTESFMPQVTIGRDDAINHIAPVDDVAALLSILTTTPLLEVTVD
jgi:chemotaxis response regulator CheB